MKFKSKLLALVENDYNNMRYEQGGFLIGDLVHFKEDALSIPYFKNNPPGDNTKAIIRSGMKGGKVFKISYVFSDPNDSTTWMADIYHEYSPGLWADPIRVPLSALERVKDTFPEDPNLDPVNPDFREPDKQIIKPVDADDVINKDSETQKQTRAFNPNVNK